MSYREKLKQNREKAYILVGATKKMRDADAGVFDQALEAQKVTMEKEL